MHHLLSDERQRLLGQQAPWRRENAFPDIEHLLSIYRHYIYIYLYNNRDIRNFT